MTFTTVIRPRRHVLNKAGAKPSVEPRPAAATRPILHLKTPSDS